MIKLTTKTTVTHEEIAHYAYLLWEAEGKQDGRDVEYWVKAEQLLYSSESAEENGGASVETVVAEPATKKGAKSTRTATLSNAKKPRAAAKKPKVSKTKAVDSKAKAAKTTKASAKKSTAPKKATRKKAVAKG